MDKQVIINFLTELAEMAEVFDIVIDGCGCCGSPFLRPLEDYDDEKTYSVGDDYSFLLFGTAEQANGRELKARDA